MKHFFETTTCLWVMLVGAMLITLIWKNLEDLPDDPRLHEFPEKGLRYQAKELDLSEQEKAVFKTAQARKFLVASTNQKAVLMMIDGTRNRHAVHDPVYCFLGAGWEKIGEFPVSLRGGEGMLVRVQRDKDTAEALYWFSTGKEKFSSPLKYWWKSSLRRLTHGASGSEPILFILISIQNKTDWDEILTSVPALQRS